MSVTTHPFTKKQLIDAINDSLDLPVISEATEGELIERALGQMIDYVPPVLWPILADATKGVDIELLRRVVNALSQIIIDMLPLPWLPASVKASSSRSSRTCSLNEPSTEWLSRNCPRSSTVVEAAHGFPCLV